MNAKDFGKVGVLMGGYSSERPISLKSGNAILKALLEEGCDAIGVDIVDKEISRIVEHVKKSGIEVAFIALHGELGEDGTIQAILEQLNIPYAGSGVHASQLAINKVSAQNTFRKNNISIAQSIGINKNTLIDVDDLWNKFQGSPIVVKPASEGSSIGIAFVKGKEELLPAIEGAWKYGPQILLEKYIMGRELTVGILEGKALPVIEICPKKSFFDYSAKYETGATEYIIPAKISNDICSRVQELALLAYSSLGCADFSRVDVMLDESGEAYVLEVNTIPGFTSTSLLPKAAKVAGLNFNQLCLKILSMAYGKKKRI